MAAMLRAEVLVIEPYYATGITANCPGRERYVAIAARRSARLDGPWLRKVSIARPNDGIVTCGAVAGIESWSTEARCISHIFLSKDTESIMDFSILF